jgi:hypothetical protein
MLQTGACDAGYRYDALTRLALESKEDTRRRGAIPSEPSESRTNHRSTRSGCPGFRIRPGSRLRFIRYTR